MSEIQTSTWNEVAASNTTAPPDGIPTTASRTQITNWGRETMAALKRDWDRSHTTLSSTGSSDAYVLTYAVAPPAYANGLRFSFKANFANGGSATCNVNGLGAKTIKKNSASGLVALSAGDVLTDNHVELEYDAGADALVMLNPLGAAPIAGSGIDVSGSTVSIDILDLTAETSVASDDEVAIYDTSAAAHRRMTRADFVAGLSPTAGGGIGVSGTAVSLDVTNLTAETTIASNDQIAIYDASASAHRKMNRSDFVAGLGPTAGTGIGVSGTAVSMAPTGLTAVTPASNDYVVIADTSDSGNPKKALVSELPAVIATGGMLRQLTKFTSSGTYSKPSWLKFVIIELVGGGGGGGASVATSSYQNEGGAGGGGGYSMKKIAASSLSANETVTIGAGGSGGTSGAGYTGGTGGTSSFGAHCSATGGSGGGGPADTNRGSWGGGGGVGSGGDLNEEGMHGTGGQALVTSWTSWQPDFGYGGDSRFGRGVRYGSNGGNWFGRRGNGWSPPHGYGGGGNGGFEAFSNTSYSGGAGAGGLVLIWEYE